MPVLEKIAEELHMSPKELLEESLKSYLEKRLSRIDADIFLIAKKYGIKDVFELDAKIKEGLFGEKEACDDYFVLDNLEAERDKIKRSMEGL